MVFNSGFVWGGRWRGSGRCKSEPQGFKRTPILLNENLLTNAEVFDSTKDPVLVNYQKWFPVVLHVFPHKSVLPVVTLQLFDLTSKLHSRQKRFIIRKRRHVSCIRGKLWLLNWTHHGEPKKMVMEIWRQNWARLRVDTPWLMRGNSTTVHVPCGSRKEGQHKRSLGC